MTNISHEEITRCLSEVGFGEAVLHRGYTALEGFN